MAAIYFPNVLLDIGITIIMPAIYSFILIDIWHNYMPAIYS